MPTIWIVEDEQEISVRLQQAIQKYGYRAVCVTDFQNIDQTFAKLRPDLVLLDINLPYYDGFYWCRQLRLQSNCPILFISARDGTMDQVMALENGGDDYITKPFNVDIVIAKIRSHLRRAYGEYAAPTSENVLEINGLQLDLDRFELCYQTQKVELSKREMALLELLMKEPKRLVSRDQILETLWDEHAFVDENTVNVYITRVRNRCKALGLTGVIENVRGAGYRLHLEKGKST